MEGVVAARPAPPVVGKVTGTSIQLYWEDYGAKLQGKVTYAVQESCAGSTNVVNGGSGVASAEDGRDALSVADWGTVYTGSGNATTIQGLIPSSQYRYRLRLAHDDETGPWSPVVTVATTKQAMTVTSADLIAAAAAGSSERVEELLASSDNLDIDSPDSFGRSPLMIASQQGHAAVVGKLLAAGANVSHTNGAGKSSLMLAAFAAHLEVMTLLLDKGTDIRQRDKSGCQALHLAVDGTSAEAVTLLLGHGADVDSIDTTSGWTPLIRCAVLGSDAAAEALLAAGANVNQRDRQGKTALMLAAINGRTELAKVLLKHGADHQLKSSASKASTALDFARAANHTDVVQLLQDL